MKERHSLLNARPVNVPGLPPKITGTGIRKRQLANTKCGSSLGVKVGAQRNAQEVIKTAREFAFHLMLAKSAAQEKVEGIVHPPKALAVAQELHEE
mmetsp:Transcript_19528/g.25814  ORF Transcript_19528/g.25814 Transcript_19528/m.25814 type:complete len:96 (-) Transcript_19528:590-877(-)